MASRAERQRATRQARRAAGQCQKCGADLRGEPGTRCPPCRQDNAIRARERYAELRADGRCVRCTELSDAAMCAACAAAREAARGVRGGHRAPSHCSGCGSADHRIGQCLERRAEQREHARAIAEGRL